MRNAQQAIDDLKAQINEQESAQEIPETPAIEEQPEAPEVSEEAEISEQEEVVEPEAEEADEVVEEEADEEIVDEKDAKKKLRKNSMRGWHIIDTVNLFFNSIPLSFSWDSFH